MEAQTPSMEGPIMLRADLLFDSFSEAASLYQKERVACFFPMEVHLSPVWGWSLILNRADSLLAKRQRD